MMNSSHAAKLQLQMLLMTTPTFTLVRHRVSLVEDEQLMPEQSLHQIDSRPRMLTAFHLCTVVTHLSSNISLMMHTDKVQVSVYIPCSCNNDNY